MHNKNNSITVGKHGFGHYWPYYLKSTVGANLKGQRWANSSTQTVEILVLDQCCANVSLPTMTCSQQLQPLPNLGPTITCYLGFISEKWRWPSVGPMLFNQRNKSSCNCAILYVGPRLVLRYKSNTRKFVWT